MGIRSFFSNMIARDNYDEVMEYLAVTETQHAPMFEFDNAPEELRELIQVAETPRSAQNGLTNMLKSHGKCLMERQRSCWPMTI